MERGVRLHEVAISATESVQPTIKEGLSRAAHHCCVELEGYPPRPPVTDSAIHAERMTFCLLDVKLIILS